MQSIQEAYKVLNELILGKPKIIRLALTCLLAKGHLLIEDVPGVGKTTLAQALAKILGMAYKRVQFTSDLLPTDILGVNIFEQERNTFRFHPGPIFSQILLADEINRASPKVQSALLEAMEEKQVTIDGQRYVLPTPFFVIGTQNPTEQLGTFPLPESQLDRFLMKLSLGYPSREAEHSLYIGQDKRSEINQIQDTLPATTILALQEKTNTMIVSPALAEYALSLILATREQDLFYQGLSPRAGIGLISAAKAWALLEGRKFVLPEDIKAVFISVAGHRLKAIQTGVVVNSELLRILESTPVN